MATKSIGATGRDYATLALWAAYVNALSLSAAEVGECYNDGEFTSATGVTLGGWTGASGTNTVTLKAATGHSFRDHADKLTNALRYDQSKGVGITCTGAYETTIAVTGTFFRMDGLQVKIHDVTFNQGNSVISDTGGSSVYTNCIFQSKTTRSARAIGGDNLTITNCLVLVLGASTNGIEAVANGGTPTLTDVTVVSSNSSTGTGINNPYNGCLAKNVVVRGFTTDYSGTASASSSNNATDKGSFGGTNWDSSGQVSVVGATEWESVTLDSEDLRVKSTSAKLKDNGATTGPTNDIVGTTRSGSYDIGCWEYASAASDPIRSKITDFKPNIVRAAFW